MYFHPKKIPSVHFVQNTLNQHRYHNELVKMYGFWCKDKIKENIAHIFIAELYFMLLGVTIHRHQLKKENKMNFRSYERKKT